MVASTLLLGKGGLGNCTLALGDDCFLKNPCLSFFHRSLFRAISLYWQLLSMGQHEPLKLTSKTHIWKQTRHSKPLLPFGCLSTSLCAPPLGNKTVPKFNSTATPIASNQTSAKRQGLQPHSICLNASNASRLFAKIAAAMNWLITSGSNVPTRLFLTETACLQHKQVYGFLHDEKTAAHAFGQLVSSVAACMSKPGLSETTHAQTRWMASTPPRPGPASSMAKQTQTTRGSSLLLGLEHFDYRATGPILCRIGVLVVATSRVCTSKPRIKRFPSEGPPTFPMAQTRSTSDHLVNPTGLCKSATTPTRSTLCIVMHRGALWCIVMHHCWMLPLTSIKYVAYNGHL